MIWSALSELKTMEIRANNAPLHSSLSPCNLPWQSYLLWSIIIPPFEQSEAHPQQKFQYHLAPIMFFRSISSARCWERQWCHGVTLVQKCIYRKTIQTIKHQLCSPFFVRKSQLPYSRVFCQLHAGAADPPLLILTRCSHFAVIKQFFLNGFKVYSTL